VVDDKSKFLSFSPSSEATSTAWLLHSVSKILVNACVFMSAMGAPVLLACESHLMVGGIVSFGLHSLVVDAVSKGLPLLAVGVTVVGSHSLVVGGVLKGLSLLAVDVAVVGSHSLVVGGFLTLT